MILNSNLGAKYFWANMYLHTVRGYTKFFFRTELQAAYQRRLEGEVNTWRQKLEVEFTRANNSEQKEKLQLEKQLSEVNTELNKLKALQKEERAKYLEEVCIHSVL